MPKVYISYRHQDTAFETRLIYEKLASNLRNLEFFLDVEAIVAGQDFRHAIDNGVRECDLMLVVIGRSWTSITDQSGRRRLDDPNDFVCLEIQAALKRKTPILPLIVGSAQVPTTDELPSYISEMAFRQVVPIRSGRDFDHDMSSLLHEISRMLVDKTSETQSSTDSSSSVDASTNVVIGDENKVRQVYKRK